MLAEKKGKMTFPAVKGVLGAKVIGGCFWFFIGYRIYHDGGHHFLHHHAWHDPKVVKYLENLDLKYGSNLASVESHH